jgi:hypothetical protein
MLGAVSRRCSLLTGYFKHARRSRLAIQRKAHLRGMAEYFNRFLNAPATNVMSSAVETSRSCAQ